MTNIHFYKFQPVKYKISRTRLNVSLLRFPTLKPITKKKKKKKTLSKVSTIQMKSYLSLV